MEKGTMIKDFRKKVLDLKEKISDKEFFVSRQCHAYLQNLSEAITKRYSAPITVSLSWGDPDDKVAYATDRFGISLNVNNQFFNRGTDRIDKLVLLKALTIHECAHILFTDFHLMASTMKVFVKNRKLFPEPKCEEYKEWLTDMALVDDAELGEWLSIYKNLDNAIEDGFIEQMALQTIPGDGQCLYRLRRMQQEDFDTVKVQRNNGLPDEAILFNCILSLAKYGTVKMDADDKSDPAIEALLANYNLIKAATSAQKPYDRKKLVNEIFCKLYKFMKDQQEENDEEDQNQGQDNQDDQQSQNGQNNQSGNDSSQSQQSWQDSNGTSGGGQPQDQDGQDQSADQDSQGAGSGTDGSNFQSQPQDNSQDSQSGDSNDVQNSQQNTDGTGSGTDNSRPNPSSISQNMVESRINDSIDTGAGSVLNDNNINAAKQPEQVASNAEKLESIQTESQPDTQIPAPEDMRAMDTIAEQIAKEEIDQAMEDDLCRQLKAEVNGFDYGLFNEDVDIQINREQPSQAAISIYEKDMEDIRFLVKKTVNEIRNKIKDHQNGGKINGLYQGRYLDQHSLGRFDLRCLCKNDLPEDIPNMAIGVLIDCSGSMRGEKIQYARRTALLLYHFGLALNIPVMVYGHNASFSREVDMYDLADFNSVDGKDKYRICDISAGGCNRDGAALRFCSEKLANRPEETKIMFVISDGRPSAYGDSTMADNDIKGTLMDFAKRHVKYIAVGLGEDQEAIEALYSQDLSSKVAAKFLKTNDPSELPVTIVRTIKEIIKV